MNYKIVDYNLLTPLGNAGETFLKIKSGKTGLKKRYYPKLQKEIYSSQFCENHDNTFNFLIEKALNYYNEKYDLKAPDLSIILATTKGDIDNYLMNNELSLRLLLLQIQEKYKVKKQIVTISNACVSGLSAIDYGMFLLNSKESNKVIIISVDVASEFVVSGFNDLGALSKKKCKPFDKERDGINMGEAVASVMLTQSDIHSKGNLYINSFSCFNDAKSITAPCREASGLTKCIMNSLTELNKIGISNQIQFISAHGTGTVYNDQMESKALFNNNLEKIPLVAFKGALGHTLGASALVDLILSFEMIDKKYLLPTLGHDLADADMSINIKNKGKEIELNTFLKTCSGFGGLNCSLVGYKYYN